MCYQNAAASGPQGRAALRHGILILMLPALSLFAGIFAPFLIYYRRNSPRPTHSRSTIDPERMDRGFGLWHVIPLG